MESGFARNESPRGEFPTILIVGHDQDSLNLVEGLRFDGYLVLVAWDGAEAVRLATIHSRQIHMVLAQADVNVTDLAAMLKPFRLAIPVLHLAGPSIDSRARIRELLKLPEI